MTTGQRGSRSTVRRLIITAALVVVALVGGLTTSTASADTSSNTIAIPPIFKKSCFNGVKWRKPVLTYSYVGDASRYDKYVREAAANWNAQGALIGITAAAPGVRGDIEVKEVDLKRYKILGQAAIPPARDRAMTRVPNQPYSPEHLTLFFNRFYMDRADDFLRTYTATHEMGHILGLAHPERCGLSADSIMRSGGPYLLKKATRPSYDSPREFDRFELGLLYPQE